MVDSTETTSVCSPHSQKRVVKMRSFTGVFSVVKARTQDHQLTCLSGINCCCCWQQQVWCYFEVNETVKEIKQWVQMETSVHQIHQSVLRDRRGASENMGEATP